MRYWKHTRLLVILLLAGAAAPLRAQEAEMEYAGASALGLELRRAGTTKRVLMVAAHPDDENTALLAALALGQGAEVAYLSLTRGEGGQNGIGPELDESLGLIRSEELLAARRLDGAQQFFSRAYDFGYSRSAEEAFRHWPRELILADVVAVVRAFRPDIIVPVFSGTPRDGHGQHQVSGILAREAFTAAADPAQFPEQIAAGLRPFQPAELYQALWRGGEGSGPRIAVGAFDPVIGRSHHQVAMASRSRHRSQDMGQAEEAGPRYVNMLRATPGAAPASVDASIFAGVDTMLTGWARSADAPAVVADALARFDVILSDARAAFNPLDPGALVPAVIGALRVLDSAAAQLPASDARTAELAFRIAEERADLRNLLMRAAALTLDVRSSDAVVVPGQTFELTLELWNGGAQRADVSRVAPALAAGWRAESADTTELSATIEPGAIVTRRFRVTVPEHAQVSEPYFLRTPRDGDVYNWPEDVHVGVPFQAPPVAAVADVSLAGADFTLQADATHRAVDKREGEQRVPVTVLPRAAVNVEPPVIVLPARGTADDTIDVRVTVRSEVEEAYAGTLHFDLPAGWTANVHALPLRFAIAGQSRTVDVAVLPPAAPAPGAYALRARFVEDGGATEERGVTIVQYAHTNPRPLLRPASAHVEVIDVQAPVALRVGYVMGAGDAVPQALEQLGIGVELLDEAALASGDLDRFAVIMTGIRAYEVRPDLAAHNRRLLAYAERGGTLIVQYNKYELVEGNFAPYPLTLARPHDRVTDEAAPVRVLDPAHPLVTTPNRITAADWEGWVQERGLYFPHTWDARYTPVLEMSDPGSAPLQGGILIAPVGEGTYVYTGLALFRQLPEGVPGAYRLLANLVALGENGRGRSRSRRNGRGRSRTRPRFSLP